MARRGSAKATLTVADFKKAMAKDGGERSGLSREEIDEHAITLLHSLRGLSRSDKRAALKRAALLMASGSRSASR